jgi:hypothetical protein
MEQSCGINGIRRQRENDRGLDLNGVSIGVRHKR